MQAALQPFVKYGLVMLLLLAATANVIAILKPERSIRGGIAVPATVLDFLFIAGILYCWR